MMTSAAANAQQVFLVSFWEVNQGPYMCSWTKVLSLWLNLLFSSQTALQLNHRWARNQYIVTSDKSSRIKMNLEHG